MAKFGVEFATFWSRIFFTCAKIHQPSAKFAIVKTEFNIDFLESLNFVRIVNT
jgi:hypothetical protein